MVKDRLFQAQDDSYNISLLVCLVFMVFVTLLISIIIVGWFVHLPLMVHAVFLIVGIAMTISVILCLYFIIKLKAKSKELIQSEKRYRLILNGISDYAIFKLTPAGTVLSWNVGAERIHGYQEQEIINQNLGVFYTDDDLLNNIPINVLNTAAEDGMYHEETKLVRKNGSYFLASVQLQSLYDEEKYLIGFIAIIQDISERKEKEEIAQNQADLLQLAQDAIFVRNINNEIIFWNKGAESTYGWLKDEVSGQITHNILKTIFPIPLNEIEEQLSKQNQWSGELIHTSKDGRQIIVESRWAIQRDQKGRPIGTLEVNRDITKRKKVEQDLQNREKELTHTNKKLSETEEFQKLIKESIPDIIFVKDSEFKIVEGNSSFFNIYPKEMRDKIIGFTTVENFHPEHAEQFLEKDREAFEKGRSEIIETVQFPDGRIRTLHTHKIRFHNNSDQVYIMGIAHDITEREDLIQKLLDSNTELERFAYVASHDLQEPIRMITNFSKIIAEDYKNKFDEEGLKYLHIIENAGTRMHDTINDLLEYSRIGNEAMQFVWFKCDDIAASTLENLKILIEEKQAEITYDKLPMIFGNPVQITRLLQNLITNGIKYQPLNNPPKLEIKYEENDTHWCILIKDNGLGIKEKFSTEIFQPFRRLHTWDNIKGTGLGLAICKKIVENHSGKIWVTAAETKGSLFRFTLLKPALKIRE